MAGQRPGFVTVETGTRGYTVPDRSNRIASCDYGRHVAGKGVFRPGSFGNKLLKPGGYLSRYGIGQITPAIADVNREFMFYRIQSCHTPVGKATLGNGGVVGNQLALVSTVGRVCHQHDGQGSLSGVFKIDRYPPESCAERLLNELNGSCSRIDLYDVRR